MTEPTFLQRRAQALVARCTTTRNKLGARRWLAKAVLGFGHWSRPFVPRHPIERAPRDVILCERHVVVRYHQATWDRASAWADLVRHPPVPDMLEWQGLHGNWNPWRRLKGVVDRTDDTYPGLVADTEFWSYVADFKPGCSFTLATGRHPLCPVCDARSHLNRPRREEVGGYILGRRISPACDCVGGYVCAACSGRGNQRDS